MVSLPRCFKLGLLWLIALVTALGTACPADEIELEGGAKLAGAVKVENDERLVIEGYDGVQTRVEKSEIKTRTMKPAQAYLTAEEIGQVIQDVNKENKLFRMKVTPDVILIVYLEQPLEADQEARVDKFMTLLEKSYAEAVDAVQDFSKKYKLVQKKPQYPATVVVFESIASANKIYELDSNSSPGVSNLYNNGWYEPTSNYASFALPEVLGELGGVRDVLVFQQLYHTGILKRHAPVPLWFLAGLATGFDMPGDRIAPNHLKLCPATFSSLQNPDDTLIDWDKMVSDYDYYITSEEIGYYGFRDQAWALHWYLINKNKAAYGRYWKTMSALSPLDDYVTEKAAADFKKAFGNDPKGFQPQFKKAFETAARTQPPPSDPETSYIPYKEAQGSIRLKYVLDPMNVSDLRVEGNLTNVSPFRPLSFCVGVETNRGQSMVWFVDKLEPGKSVELKVKRPEAPPADKAKKAKAPEAVGEHDISDYWILSAFPDSPEAEKWRGGDLPVTNESESKAE